MSFVSPITCGLPLKIQIDRFLQDVQSRQRRKRGAKILQEHQITAIQKIISLLLGAKSQAYLADEMGLGKTTTCVISAMFLISLNY